MCQITIIFFKHIHQLAIKNSYWWGHPWERGFEPTLSWRKVDSQSTWLPVIELYLSYIYINIYIECFWSQNSKNCQWIDFNFCQRRVRIRESIYTKMKRKIPPEGDFFLFFFLDFRISIISPHQILSLQIIKICHDHYLSVAVVNSERILKFNPY